MKALLWRRHFDMRRCVATGSFSLPHGRKAKERIRTYSEYIIYIYGLHPGVIHHEST